MVVQSKFVGGVFVLSRSVWDLGVGAFFLRLSQISSFFSQSDYGNEVFLRITPLPPKTHFNKTRFMYHGLDLLNIPTFSEITVPPLEAHNI